MAVQLGISSGFVEVAPSADPAGTALAFDGSSWVTKDTSPATAAKINQILWWCDNATEEANFEIALYAADGAVVPGEAGTRLYLLNTNAKGTTAGWKSVVVDWAINSSTAYWLGVSLADTATATNTDRTSSGGAGIDSKAGLLIDPYGGGALGDVNGMYAVCAVWEAAGGSITPILNHHRSQMR